MSVISGYAIGITTGVLIQSLIDEAIRIEKEV